LFYLRLTWLYFIRITRGEFSGIYFNSFGKFRKRYPDYRGRIKTCFREEMLVHLDKVLMRNPLYPEFRSTDVILFNNLPFGSSKAKILDKMGKPDCVKYENYAGGQWEVLGYHDSALGLPMKVYFFLIKGVLFFGEYLANPELSKSLQRIGDVVQRMEITEKLDQFVSTLGKKYNVGLSSALKGGYILDPSGSVIFYFNSADVVTVRYLSMNVKGVEESLSRLMKGLSRLKTKDPALDSIADRL